MTAILRAGFLALTALWLAGCVASNPVTVDYDPQADFSRLQSYFLLEPLASGPVSPLELKRADQAADSLLRMRYQPAQSADSADFLVRVQLHAVDKVAVYEDSFALYGGYPYWVWGWHVPLEVRHYRENSLVLDVFSSQHSPLWRGSIISSADWHRDPQRRHQRLREELALMLDRFPPQQQ